MPLLIGSATVVCMLVSLAIGQIDIGIQAMGVLLAAGVLMSLQRQ
jgi:hypothetical protein